MNINRVYNQYQKNEENNDHSENAVLLARYFGTPDDLKRAKEILSEHRKSGSIPEPLYQERYKLTQRLYKIMTGMRNGTQE